MRLGIADVTVNSPVFDSTWVVNGRTVYRYSLPSQYNISAIGTYPIKVVANNPTSDGCGGIQEIDYDLQVFNPPIAGFYFNTNGCVTSPVNFFDTSNTGGRARSFNGTGILEMREHLQYKTHHILTLHRVPILLHFL